MRISLVIFAFCFILGSTLAAQDPALAGAQVRRSPVAPVFMGLSLAPYSGGEALPEPESGSADREAYRNSYFGIAYSFPDGWQETFKGPPPSAGGYYVLHQLKTIPQGSTRGSLVISATDLFFLRQPADDSLALLRQKRQALPSVMTIEREPASVMIGGRSFARMDYTGAGIHWSALATDVRCHAVQFLLASRDADFVQKVIAEMGAGELSLHDGTDLPVCLKDYANAEHLLRRVDPALVGPKYTTIAARIIIDQSGNVRHVHVINAFAEEAKSVSDALMQWRFKPYTQAGIPREVETGVLFEFDPDGVKTEAAHALR